MKTIVLSANPTPNMNLAKINIDHNNFDPHCGPSFWVTFYNPAGNIIDRVVHSMTFDQWQDWTSESSEITDYKYIADSITEDLGLTYIDMISPPPPVPPSISTQPSGASLYVGNLASFIVYYAGDYPMTFQWYKDGVAIENATTPNYTIASVALSDAGSYTVKISNSVGDVTSNPAVLTVTAPVPPSITTQPQDKTVEFGANFTLTVAAEGTAPLMYMWKKNATAIYANPSTDPSLNIVSAKETDAGIYSVDVTNTFGATQSNSVTVVVNAAPEPPAQ
jgi:hypothetical protein